MILRRLGSNTLHRSMLDYPTMTAHFIADYETPAVEAPHARCGVMLNNRRGDVVVMQTEEPTCRACKRAPSHIEPKPTL